MTNLKRETTHITDISNETGFFFFVDTDKITLNFLWNGEISRIAKIRKTEKNQSV